MEKCLFAIRKKDSIDHLLISCVFDLDQAQKVSCLHIKDLVRLRKSGIQMMTMQDVLVRWSPLLDISSHLLGGYFLEEL